jgi:hypothetical protein
VRCGRFVVVEASRGLVAISRRTQRAPCHPGWLGCGGGSFTLAVHGRTMLIQVRVVAIALSIAFGSLSAACFDRSSADAQQASSAVPPLCPGVAHLARWMSPC